VSLLATNSEFSSTRRATPKLSKATTAELVALLAHPNAWHRETASRLLFERQDDSAVSALNGLAASSASPLGRLHAIYTLDGMNALTAQHIVRGLADEHPRVRENAAQLAGLRFSNDAAVAEALLARANDDDLWVRYRVAFAVGDLAETYREACVTTLGQVLRRDGDNRWMRLAVLSSLAGQESGVLATLLRDESFRSAGHAPAVCSELAAIVARRNKPAEIAAVTEAIAAAPDSPPARAVVNVWIAEPSSAVRSAFASGALHDLVARRLEAAEKTALDDDAAIPQRLTAIGTLQLAPFDTAAEAFDELANGRQPAEVQRAAVELLRSYNDAHVAERLMDAWPRLSPSVREVVAEALTATAATAGQLLDAIEAGRFDAAALPEARRKLLREHPVKPVRERASKLLGNSTLSQRNDVVAAYQPALEMKGDASRGQAIFKKQCMVCHKIGGEGHEVGPNLTAIKARGPEFILLNILDPSREVNPEFVDYALVTTDGVVKTGLIASESPTAITLKRSEGVTESVLRLDIEELQSSGRSIMPDGLEKQIDPQGMADLIAYLMSLE